ncbi:MAG: hypothetical protein QM680_05200 [Luteolibacter sp.]
MASDHPFQLLFETFGRVPLSHAESVNRKAYEQLKGVLSVSVENAGRCILLKAPRAGHGKTHLLSRLQHEFGISHEFVPLQAASGYRIDAASVIDDTLRRLVRSLPASGGLCVLDLLARRLFSQALQPLVRSGEVPCQDREGALTALQGKPVETFDFHHPNAVTAHWARENFEVLGPRLSLELSQRSDLPLREVSFWVNALFRFAATPLEDPTRARVLSETVFSQAPAESDGDSMERLGALLGLITSLVRVVLVADDLEGFSADETAALRLAAFLGSLRQSVERLDVILSLNQDIWESAFLPRLSGGLADRLSEVVVPLEPLAEDEIISLIESRAPGKGREILQKLNREEAGSHSRGIIRAAAAAWDSPAPAVVSEVVEPDQPGTSGFTPAPEPVIAEESSSEDEPPPVPEFFRAAGKEALVEPEEKEPVSELGSSPFTAAEAATPAFMPPPHGLVSQTEEVIEATAVREASDNPFQSAEPEPAAFNPFSKPAAPPTVEVEASEVTPHPVWPSPTFAAPSVGNPFSAFDKPETHAAPESASAAISVDETLAAPVPKFASPFQTEPSPAAFTPAPPAPETPAFQPFQAAPAPEASAFQPVAQPVAITPQSTANPFLAAPTQPAAPAAPVFMPASIVVEPPVTPAPPFGAPAEQVVAADNQLFSSTPASGLTIPEPSAAETDRVDELLRQFRERYGRGTL